MECDFGKGESPRKGETQLDIKMTQLSFGSGLMTESEGKCKFPYVTTKEDIP